MLDQTDRPVVELPTLPDAIDQGALFELARLLRDDLLDGGDPRMTGRPATSPKRRRQPSRATGPAAPGTSRDAVDIDALLADRAHRDHRVLRLRRGRQDDDGGRTRRCGPPSRGARSAS